MLGKTLHWFCGVVQSLPTNFKTTFFIVLSTTDAMKTENARATENEFASLQPRITTRRGISYGYKYQTQRMSSLMRLL